MQAVDVKKSDFKSVYPANTWDLSCMTPRDLDIWTNGDNSAETMAARWSGMVKPSQSTVLDIGTGFGWGARCFARYGFKVSAIDISNDAINRAKTYAGPQLSDIDFQLGDMLNIPYDSHSFDFVFASNILYLTDRMGLNRALDEIHRVLKPSGQAWFNLLCKSLMIPGYGHRIDNYSLIQRAQFGTHKSVTTYTDGDDIPELLQGFDILNVDWENRRYYITAQKTAER